MGEGLRGAFEGVLGVEHGVEVEDILPDEIEGGLKAAAAGADEGDFIDDERGGVDGEAFVHG